MATAGAGGGGGAALRFGGVGAFGGGDFNGVGGPPGIIYTGCWFNGAGGGVFNGAGGDSAGAGSDGSAGSFLSTGSIVLNGFGMSL